MTATAVFNLLLPEGERGDSMGCLPSPAHALGRKHYSVLSSLHLSEPRMPGTFPYPSKVCGYFPFRPLLMHKLGNREPPGEASLSKISN